MAGKKVCIITQSHLCRNPRVVKEALALADARYEVTILNNTYDKLLTGEDKKLVGGRNIHILSIAQLEDKQLSSFSFRLFKRVGDALVRYLKIQTPWALGYASWRFKPLAIAQNADLYICHQELGLYCGVQLLHSQKKVAFDFEDWYSEDLLDEARQKRPIRLLKKLEKFALQKGAFCFTTSHAMANELAKAYNAAIPETVYNTFTTDEQILLRPKSFEQPLKLLWFSQTIGPGRGLEAFLQFIAKVDAAVEIHLLGQVEDSYKSQLLTIQNRHPVFFHPLVSSTQLAKRIADFDIGLALEMNYPLSRNYTVTNKLFQYILSGLPVIATNTVGQEEIMNKYNCGVLIDYNLSEKTTNVLRLLLNNPAKLSLLKQKAVEAAEKLDWKNKESGLLVIIKQTI